MDSAVGTCALDGCGRTFPIVKRPGQPQKYCTPEHRREDNQKKAYGPGEITKQCEACGRAFRPPVRYPKRRFCSRVCAASQMKRATPVPPPADDIDLDVEDDGEASPIGVERLGNFFIKRMPDGSLATERAT